MADDPKKPERTTSAAKQIDPDKLAYARSLKQEFDRAKAAHHKTHTRDAPVRQTQQHAPRPKPQLRPTLPGTRTVDRQAFNERQNKERQRVRELQEELKAREKAQKQLGLDKEREKDRER